MIPPPYVGGYMVSPIRSRGEISCLAWRGRGMRWAFWKSANVPALAAYLADDVAAFDPAKPDAPQEFRMAASPAADARPPDGN